MKKTLSLLAVVGIAAVIGAQSAQAFSWSKINPFTWGCNSRWKILVQQALQHLVILVQKEHHVTHAKKKLHSQNLANHAIDYSKRWQNNYNRFSVKI